MPGSIFLHLAFAATYGFAAAVMPGPLLAFLASRAARDGLARTAPAALAPVLTDGPIAALVLLVLHRVPPSVISLLRVGGGLYLVFLGVEAFRAWRGGSQSEETAATRGGTLLRAALVNLLNPNPYLGWSLVLGPLFLEGWAASPGSGLAVLVGFYGTMAATLVALIALFAAAGHIGPQLNRALLAISAAGLLAFATLQLWLAVADVALSFR